MIFKHDKGVYVPRGLALNKRALDGLGRSCIIDPLRSKTDKRGKSGGSIDGLGYARRKGGAKNER